MLHGAESKEFAPFSIYFCKRKEHGESRAPLSELKNSLEKYIGKLGITIANLNIQFAVNFMYQTNIIIGGPENPQILVME